MKKVCLILLVSLVCAFGEQTVAFQVGVQLYKQGQFDEALKVLTKEYKKDKTNALVIRTIGQIKAELEEWGDTKDWMKKALDIDETDIVAKYYLGIAYRETGKGKALLLRKRDWDRSERYFSEIIEIFPEYEDVLLQYSILQRYRKNYIKAIDVGERQVRQNPKKTDALRRLHRHYDALLEHENPDQVEDLLSVRQDTFPRAALYLGEWFRRNKMFEKADSIFTHLQNFNSEHLSQVAVNLSFSRSKFQQNDEQASFNYFVNAIESIKSVQDASIMFEEVKFVMNDKELEFYNSIETVEGLKYFHEKLWVKRDPLASSTVNYRIIEHIRRSLYAEKWFRYDGFRMPINNPDKLHYLKFPKVFDLNDKFNDKGLVYIRHGEPDDKAFSIADSINENESWLYKANGAQGKLIFHFYIDQNAAGNNWRLSPILDYAMLETRLDWDPIFFQMQSAESAADAFTYQMDMIEQSQEMVELGMDTDRHSWKDEVIPILFPFYASTFRGENYWTNLEIYYGIQAKDLPIKKLDDDSDIVFTFGLFDENWNEVKKVEKTVGLEEISRKTESQGMWLDQFQMTVKPGRYQANLAVEAIDANGVGGYKFKSVVSSYYPGEPLISDITLSPLIEEVDKPEPFTKNGLKIIPAPARIFSRNQPVYLYFELYDLPYYKNERTEFVLEYQFKLINPAKKNILQQVGGLFKKSQPLVTNRVERVVKEPDSIEYLAVDLAKQEPGRYELEIRAVFEENIVSKTVEFDLK